MSDANQINEVTAAVNNVDVYENESALFFKSEISQVLWARHQIAEVIVKALNAGTPGIAVLGEDVLEKVVIKLDKSYFELTVLCGGYMVSEDENGELVRDPEFTPIDDIVNMFGIQEPAARNFADDLEFIEEDDAKVRWPELMRQPDGSIGNGSMLQSQAS